MLLGGTATAVYGTVWRLDRAIIQYANRKLADSWTKKAVSMLRFQHATPCTIMLTPMLTPKSPKPASGWRVRTLCRGRCAGQVVQGTLCQAAIRRLGFGDCVVQRSPLRPVPFSSFDDVTSYATSSLGGSLMCCPCSVAPRSLSIQPRRKRCHTPTRSLALFGRLERALNLHCASTCRRDGDP